MSDQNTWPGGIRRALDQSEHERWNATHYPGTRQLCARCDAPTGNCEEDSIYVGDDGPLCGECAAIARLPISALQSACVKRSAEFNSIGWTPAQWLQALVGEVGEYANLRKKHERGDIDATTFKRLAQGELADIQCYLVLLADCIGIDLAAATVAKFNEVSERRGSALNLPPAPGEGE